MEKQAPWKNQIALKVDRRAAGRAATVGALLTVLLAASALLWTRRHSASANVAVARARIRGWLHGRRSCTSGAID